jgi:phage gp45-like
MGKEQGEIINDLLQKITLALRVAMPASVESYDFKTQKADVKIEMQELYRNDTSIEYPILSGVPVIFPRCGGASITMPIKRGDTCLIVFLDRDSTSWLLGGKNLKPKSMRNHHLSDAVAIMGLSPFVSKSAAKNNTDMLISFDGSTITLKPNGIVEIISAKELNIKTENIIINCKTANVKAAEVVSVDCKTANVKAAEVVSVDCKTANVKAAEVVSVDCKTANVKAAEVVSVDCKTLTAKVAQVATIDCQSANVKASSTINTEAPTFNQKGNLKITGNIEVTGTSTLTDNLTCAATIQGLVVKTSTGINLATHTHGYIDSVPVGKFVPTPKTSLIPT